MPLSLEIQTMKLTVAFAAFFTLTLFQNSNIAAQCAISPVSLEKRVASSSAIAQGKVVEKHTYVDEATGNVYTRNKVVVNAWLKSPSSVSELEVITLGGVYNDKATIAYPALELNDNSEYIFFLESNNFKHDDKGLRLQKPAVMQVEVYAEMQGALKNEGNNYKDLFERNAVSESVIFSKITGLSGSKVLTPGGKEFAARKAVVNNSANNLRVAALDAFSPSSTNGGTIVPGEFITITGSGFGATAGTVSFRNANDGGATYITSAVASDITAWSDNSITVKVPASAGTGTIRVNGASIFTSASSLAVGYTHIDINSNFSGFGSNTRQRFYLRNLNGLGGYTFLFNNAFNANTAAVDAFNRSVSTWVCATGVNFRTGGTTAATAGNDGVNVVLFDASLPAGVLGRATSNFSGSATGGCNGANTVWWTSDIDVQFKPDPPVAGFAWEYGPANASGSEFDFESVSVHELGHALGLGHRISSGAVMHYALSNGLTVRTPSATEVSGANAKLSYSTSATCFNPPGSGSEMQLSGCTLPVTFISFSGKRNGKLTNDLTWVASHSNNNTGYAIERSADGENFSQIGFVAETNPSVAEQSYKYADNKAGIYPWYYRLKQTDLDGKYSYSNVIYLKGDNNNNWRAFASPDGTVIHLYGNLPTDNAVKFQLISSSGQQVINRMVANLITDISASGLAKGVYYYKIIDNNNSLLLSGSLLLGK